jgi:hypothetical protein
MRAVGIAVGIILLLGITGSHANASPITATYDLTTFNTTNGTVSAPYEEIDISGDTTAGTVSFTVKVTPANIASGNAKFAEFGLNASTLLRHLNASNFTGFTPSNFAWSGAKNLDGYGSFNEVVKAPDSSAGNRTASLTFKITGINTLVGNNHWTLTSDTGSSEILFTPNTGGHLFASDYFPGTGNTGFVDGAVFQPGIGTNVTTPEPSSALLLGLGGIGVAFFRRRHARVAA